MTNGQTEQIVTVSAGEVTVTRFAGVSGLVCKVDGAILFETALSFIRPTPDHKGLLARVFALGLTRLPSGSGTVPVPDKFLFIAGHTDQVGSASSNRALSERRAEATLAIFIADETIWENIYQAQAENWASKTSDGIDIVEVMSNEVDLVSDPLLIQNYKNNPADRLDLMRRYLLALRPASLTRSSPLPRPALVTGSSSHVIPCGKDHPIRNAPNTDVAENRRSEFFYSSVSDPSITDCTDYRTWLMVCGGQFFTVHLSLENEYSEPLANQPFTLMLPHGGIVNDRTDTAGVWLGDNLPAGLYTVNADNQELTELPGGTVSTQQFEKSLSAANSQIRLQAIDLDRWLIPRQHPAIPRFTRGNIVEPLIDGESAFRAMHDAFNSTGIDGYIYITGWDMVPDIHLLARRRGPASQLQNILGSARGRGVDVRILLWYVNAIRIPGRPHRGGLGQNTWESFPWARIFTDNKTRGPGSHHQKTAAVRTREGLVGFVGGIDLTADRWDTPVHAFPNPDADYELNGGQPWHDVHARVRGPAAGDIETNFRQRWNDANRLPGFPGPTPTVPVHAAPPELSNGAHIVQTLRTFPHHATALGTTWNYDFAPTGEFGFRQAYRRAINNARDYIYIEDQYLISDREISPLIAAAMRRSAHIQVILVTAPEPDTPPRDAFDFHQNAFVNNLRAVDPARVEIYHLVNASGRGIYCHSKICIVDDIWAIIGSCNMSTRSLTHDSEIGIAVLDGALEGGRRKFARNLRKALWAEHLGLTPAGIPDNPNVGAALWRSRAGSSPAHAVLHRRPPGSDSLVWDTVVDPDGSTP